MKIAIKRLKGREMVSVHVRGQAFGSVGKNGCFIPAAKAPLLSPGQHEDAMELMPVYKALAKVLLKNKVYIETRVSPKPFGVTLDF